jgi:hypothetical protein
MPDNWGFVAAAYLLAAVVLGGYWRRLVRRERALMLEGAAGAVSPAPPPGTRSRQGGANTGDVARP